ncbi:DNA cytosine methyltransferase [Chitiniphilus eburneus]|uniref:DNA cytosine methyltransferase n=1 Tax=Chitiniphilus eburneus TaxID=2571148 RepID=UPI0035D0FF1E
MTHHVEILHGHICCGIGGGADGFNRARPRVGNSQARFRCIGGIDVDPAGIRDFEQRVGVPGTVLDLFDRQQYVDFHGHQPPAEWREATPADIKRAMGGERPHVWFTSTPCKGLSGLMSETKSRSIKYQALNRLTVRAMWLALEAYQDDPVELFVFENVPRIANRGRHLLDQIVAMLEAYGYAVRETTHDCGELGGLAQSRKRFLLVARHMAKVPAFLYEPEKKRLQGVGTVLGRMPLPGDDAAGPMHRIPSLQWKTWVRLAFVEAGRDWRSLDRLTIQDGVLRDYLIVPGAPLSGLGALAVIDPRAPAGAAQYQQYGVLQWDEACGAMIGVKSPGQGSFSVADPRQQQVRHNNVLRVVRFDSHAGTVTSGVGPTSGGQAVADPRSGMRRGAGDHYLTGGHYGVVRWEDSAGAVSANACHDNGRWSVAEPRLPAATDKLTCVIVAEDGTWHRPFTTLEMAALQSLVEPEDYLELDGLNDQNWRERIGNAVPPAAAQAIAEVMGTTLLLAWSGETFVLSATPVWVRPVAMALTLLGGAHHG